VPGADTRIVSTYSCPTVKLVVLRLIPTEPGPVPDERVRVVQDAVAVAVHPWVDPPLPRNPTLIESDTDVAPAVTVWRRDGRSRATIAAGSTRIVSISRTSANPGAVTTRVST
jgi:hypothetical protein